MFIRFEDCWMFEDFFFHTIFNCWISKLFVESMWSLFNPILVWLIKKRSWINVMHDCLFITQHCWISIIHCWIYDQQLKGYIVETKQLIDKNKILEGASMITLNTKKPVSIILLHWYAPSVIHWTDQEWNQGEILNRSQSKVIQSKISDGINVSIFFPWSENAYFATMRGGRRDPLK